MKFGMNNSVSIEGLFNAFHYSTVKEDLRNELSWQIRFSFND